MSTPVKPYVLTPALIALIRGDLDQRPVDFMRVAQHHWNIHRFRKIGLPDNQILETWWDPRSHNWITQHKNDCGFQLGDAEFAGCQQTAAFNHFYALYAIIKSQQQ